MKISLVPALLLFSSSLSAQYYYTDITGTHETSEMMKQYNLNKVRTVSASGVDANGIRASNYSEFYEVKDNGRTLRKTIIREFNRTVSVFSFDAQGRVQSVADSAADLQSKTSYEYDAAGRITLMREMQNDSASEFAQTEEHRWTYATNGQPAGMWRTINNSDSLQVQFTYDENGKPGEEIHLRRGVEVNRIYYYYDEKSNLTDVVRYNKKIKKLIPDIILSYDDAGHIIQKMTVAPSDNFGRVVWVGYFIWRYIFNSQGLKTKEALFDNDQKLTGKIEYNYTFGR
ncbi:MAG: RHS repeat protein [Bacteroidetes bacterium]|nr:RHS repeat protein [Bacteroidota bacterium]